MIFVIYGEESFLMEQKLQSLKKEYDCNEDNMNISTYRANEDSLEEVYEDLITPPFLTDKKMVVLKNPYFLTTKKVKKDNHYKLSDSTRQAIRRRDATIDDDALELLLSRLGDSLNNVALEVEKLCLYSKHITYDIVDELVSKPLDENVFALTSAILQKDRRKMFSIYHDLMILNEEPIKLIVLIAGQMRLIYQVKLLDRKGYNDKEIGKILGVNPYRLKYVRQEGKDFDLNELLQCLDDLSRLDVEIKTGKMDKKMGLELFMVRI